MPSVDLDRYFKERERNVYEECPHHKEEVKGNEAKRTTHKESK